MTPAERRLCVQPRRGRGTTHVCFSMMKSYSNKNEIRDAVHWTLYRRCMLSMASKTGKSSP